MQSCFCTTTRCLGFWVIWASWRDGWCVRPKPWRHVDMRTGWETAHCRMCGDHSVLSVNLRQGPSYQPTPVLSGIKYSSSNSHAHKFRSWLHGEPKVFKGSPHSLSAKLSFVLVVVSVERWFEREAVFKSVVSLIIFGSWSWQGSTNIMFSATTIIGQKGEKCSCQYSKVFLNALECVSTSFDGEKWDVHCLVKSLIPFKRSLLIFGVQDGKETQISYF